MAKIKAFKGIRPVSDKVAQIAHVIVCFWCVVLFTKNKTLQI